MAITTDKLAVGILAHVDAGKTTLAEGILYQCGSIRKLGRVDHKDAFLDTNTLERARGITIFSKQAIVTLGDKEITLLDTPGHVDFSAEMERTLQVLDYAVLVISGADGVQGHVETLWRLLKRYEIPVFLFINKMDQEGTDSYLLLQELRKRLDECCVDFTPGKGNEVLWEELAMCSEVLLESYLETNRLEPEEIGLAITQRKVFPCFFGSALKMTGVEEFLDGWQKYMLHVQYPEEFGARVFKISRDSQGNRLTYLKVTGGSLRVKQVLTNQGNQRKDGKAFWEDKVDQIRVYSGAGYTLAEEALAGTICAVTGLSQTYSGEGLGCELQAEIPLLEPVLTYQLLLSQGYDTAKMLGQLRQLEEEVPELHLLWKEDVGEIHVQVMGEVQMEILQSLIQERFAVFVEFGTGSIVYKETITGPVEGIGHFEPLRHYAEVHLLLEPGERGSGLEFASLCSEDVLDRNWQRLILTHLEERQHPGVLTGAEITDLKISLLTGRAHLKHTEGGDFRQATYRAVRQGMKKAQSILLEPIYEFTLEIPMESVGRAMTDIQKMCGKFESPTIDGEFSVLTGTGPVATMRGYQQEVTSYTKGRGRFQCVLKGYDICHNSEEVIASIGYDSEADLANPTGSVFCAHGAGYVVSWDQVDNLAHVESNTYVINNKVLETWQNSQANLDSKKQKEDKSASNASNRNYVDEEELEAIFTRTYGPIKRERNHFRRSKSPIRPTEGTNALMESAKRSKKAALEEYLLVDGYNIIFAWEELSQLAKVNIDSARTKLMDILCNYQGYQKNTVILVFDAYKVKGNPGTVVNYHNIYVVYTKEAETADQYIEKTVHSIGRKYQVTVATSDALEQMIIWGQGAIRMSAMGLWEEMEATKRKIREEYLEQSSSGKHYPFQGLSDTIKKQDNRKEEKEENKERE